MDKIEDLPYLHVSKVTTEDESKRSTWLVESLWLSDAVGIIGAAPKSCKSWLGLDLAISVASATPCLGKFRVLEPGKALIFLAEDSISSVKKRIENICASRRLNLSEISLYLITAPSLSLNTEKDQKRLTCIIEQVKPRLLVLDPLVRIHSADENSAQEMSKLLSFFRTLQRQFNLAIVLVHHAGKKVHTRAGLNLRGSSDFYAFVDSSLFLSRKKEKIEVTVEHRSAAAISPLTLELISKDDAVYLQLAEQGDTDEIISMEEQIIGRLKTSPMPLTREKLRTFLRIKNERLGEVLGSLEATNKITHVANGWTINNTTNLN